MLVNYSTSAVTITNTPSFQPQKRIGVAIGDHVLDLFVIAHLYPVQVQVNREDKIFLIYRHSNKHVLKKLFRLRIATRVVKMIVDCILISLACCFAFKTCGQTGIFYLLVLNIK